MLLHINTLAYVIKLTNDDENIAEDEEEILSSMYKTHTPPTSSNHQHYILTNFFFLRHLSSSSSSSPSLLFFLFWYSWFERDVLSAMLDEWRRRKYLACARARFLEVCRMGVVVLVGTSSAFVLFDRIQSARWERKISCALMIASDWKSCSRFDWIVSSMETTDRKRSNSLSCFSF